jgi:adenine-specific DNA-methyltransferase
MTIDYLHLVETSYRAGQIILAGRSEKSRKEQGQFISPLLIAHYMAQQLGRIESGSRILDPAVGSGTLLCAVIERLIAEGRPTEVWLDGYEIDGELCQAARDALMEAAHRASEVGIHVHVCIIQADFILDGLNALRPDLFGSAHHLQNQFHHLIANPPYFKLNKEDIRVKAARGIISGYTNIYALFMALGQKLLHPEGTACFIVPRSFCSGAYFSTFREDFLANATPLRFHLFESRQDTFKQDNVLQENIILSFGGKAKNHAPAERADSVIISESRNGIDIFECQERCVSTSHFIHRRGQSVFFRLPASELDEQLLDIIDRWTGSLHQHGLEVSTGPVVPFRSRDYLLDGPNAPAVPLLWLHNVKSQRVEWPVTNGSKSKQQWFVDSDETNALLLHNANYVLVRRFSAKEEARRLVAAPLLKESFSYPRLAIENHLNYIYRKQGMLGEFEAIGLSALYNSALLDRYFRIGNGNTQVNAAELRALPLPSMVVVSEIGRKVSSSAASGYNSEIIVADTLKAFELMPFDFPLITETRTAWAR